MLLWQGRIFDLRCLQYLCLCDNNSPLKKGVFVNLTLRAVTQVCVCVCVCLCVCICMCVYNRVYVCVLTASVV